MHQRFVLSVPLVIVILTWLCSPTFGQGTSSGSNPQAVALASKAFSALVGSAQINDVTLTGMATRTAGSSVESGNIALKALGNSLSRFDFSFSDGTRTELRNLSGATPQGFWIAPDGTTHSMASHNCVTDAVWFFPAFSALSQLSNPNLVVTYIAAETRNGVAVQHLLFTLQSSADATGTLQRLSSEEFYLSASSYLPVAVVFNSHPDNDDLTKIPVEIDFGQYQVVGGVQIPYQIEELLNGTPYLNITIQSAVLNSGLSQGDFSAQ
jgi:hypothetical protein